MDNQQRANYGNAAMRVGTPDYGQNDKEHRTDLVDTLGNLMHWARLNNIDFSDALQSAEMHFEEEACRTPGCIEDAGGGEGYDGHCGSCADKREPGDPNDINSKIDFLRQLDQMARGTESPILSGGELSAFDNAALEMIESLNSNHLLIARALLEMNEAYRANHEGGGFTTLIPINTVRELSQMIKRD